MDKSSRMVCSDLNAITYSKSIPYGYDIRTFTFGEADIWADIVTSSGEFETKNQALDRFNKEFSSKENDFCNRCLFLTNTSEDIVVGTATAWYDEKNPKMGRLHWVSIKKEYQGRGLARPLIYTTINLLKEYHHHAYLTTQESSWKAIGIYEDCGFVRM